MLENTEIDAHNNLREKETAQILKEKKKIDEMRTLVLSKIEEVDKDKHAGNATQHYLLGSLTVSNATHSDGAALTGLCARIYS